MNSDQLKYFIIAAKHLNFSAAANELYITQPAISHQMNMLEKELGVTLFHRTTRKIELTKAGELFLEDAKRILDLEESARDRIRIAERAESVSLRIAYLLAPTQTFLPKLIFQFRMQYPQVDIKLTQMDAFNISEAFHSDEYDLFFSMTKDLDSTDLCQRTLFKDKFCLSFCPNHPCAASQKLDFNKMASENFLLLDTSVGPFMTNEILQYCRSNNFHPKSFQYLHSMDEIMFCTEAGQGVTILPAKILTHYASNLTYIPLEGPHTAISLAVAWNPNTDNPAVSWFLDLTDSFKQKYPELF